jgi:hypothetical protein
MIGVGLLCVLMMSIFIKILLAYFTFILLLDKQNAKTIFADPKSAIGDKAKYEDEGKHMKLV